MARLQALLLLRPATRRTPLQKRCVRTTSRFSSHLARDDDLVLGIETSADDTCVALLHYSTPAGGSTRIAHQERVTYANQLHRGIHPVEAVKNHTVHLSRLIHNAIRKLPSPNTGRGSLLVTAEEAAVSRGLGMPFVDSESRNPPPYVYRKPDLIAVTQGPGMGGCLSVGVTTAKALSMAWSVPVIGVHHMQAHALTPLMMSALRDTTKISEHRPEYPFLTLLVSGKHTMLVYTKSAVYHRILASTGNIALGDVLDKVSRGILPNDLVPEDARSVVYPKLMEDFVSDLEPERKYQAPETPRHENKNYESEFGWVVPPPLRDSKSMKYDLSGLNGVVLDILGQRPDMGHDERKCLALHTMRLSFEHLMSRVILALKNDEELVAEPPRTLAISGGVASNMFLRKVAQSTLEARGFNNVRVVAPPPSFCTDNAAMIAYAGATMYFDGGWRSDNAFVPKAQWSIEKIIYENAGYWVRRPGFGPAKEMDAHAERLVRGSQALENEGKTAEITDEAAVEKSIEASTEDLEVEDAADKEPLLTAEAGGQ